MTLLKGEPKSDWDWSGKKIFPLFEEEQRELATLTQVKCMEDNRPVRVTVERRQPDGSWAATSTVVDLTDQLSTEQTVDTDVRLVVTET
jgi:hypothetical protein